ncbi:HDL320Cp [Eremothecium sinecaudum]|uniref:HDL320Cp n=1 Tax=Eremothecium sinecaudum TaxID=45286 RepID=A0A0X8HS47_9SACH|nr:HDL320Cp [Eremothecium sinecaudum]AMD20424.1 HDL320Cp [Eremothecium sinecaudum]
MLRSIARSSLLKRSISTTVAPKPEITELSNGIIVATEGNPASHTASVGVVFGSGASSENPYNNGVSNLFSTAFKSAYGAEAAKSGYSLTSAVDREYQSYVVNTTASGVNKALDFLQDKLSKPLSDSVFLEAKSKTIKAVNAFEENEHAERVMEHLHATAFQNTPLSLPKRGTEESLSLLENSDLQSFLKHHFVSSNAVIVGSGNISHESLLRAVESQVSLSSGSKVESKPSSFLGSEIRLRDDTLPKAWISIAAEGEPVTSPNYYVAQVAAEVFGTYMHTEPASKLQGVKLLDTVSESHLADYMEHYSLSYKDSGLFGFSAITTNFGQIDDLVHFTLKQWNRLSISITETEIARAKKLLKLKLATANSDNATAAIRLGAQTLARGASPALSEVFAKIDSVNVASVKKWANARLWDHDVAVCGTGQIEGLLDYMRIRNDMSMMRW